MTDEPERLWTSANNPILAKVKRDWLDPKLRELGRDPDRYELACELSNSMFATQRPVDLKTRDQVLLALAAELDIPPELLRATTADPYNVGAFEQTRRGYMPRWCYVSGGKALHAFIGNGALPACGIDPRRGPDLRPARWIDSTNRDSFSRRSHEHGPCRRAVREHRRAMLQRSGVPR